MKQKIEVIQTSTSGGSLQDIATRPKHTMRDHLRVMAYLVYAPTKWLAVLARKWLGFQWRDYNGPDDGTMVIVIAFMGLGLTMWSIGTGTLWALPGVALGAFIWVPPVIAGLWNLLGFVIGGAAHLVSLLASSFIEMYRKKLNERK